MYAVMLLVAMSANPTFPTPQFYDAFPQPKFAAQVEQTIAAPVLVGNTWKIKLRDGLEATFDNRAQVWRCVDESGCTIECAAGSSEWKKVNCPVGRP